MTATPTLPDTSTPLVDTRPGIKYSLWAMINHPNCHTTIIKLESILPSAYGIRRILEENGIRRADGWELMDWNAGEPEGFLTEEDEEFLDYQELLDYVLAA